MLAAVQVRSDQQLKLACAGLSSQFLQEGPAVALQAAPLGSSHTHGEIRLAEQGEHPVLLLHFHGEPEGMQFAGQLFLQLVYLSHHQSHRGGGNLCGNCGPVGYFQPVALCCRSVPYLAASGLVLSGRSCRSKLVSAAT